MAFTPDPNNVSIDYGTYIIHVPKSVTTLVQSVPNEVRDLDLNWFRLELKKIEYSSYGIVELRTHNHNTSVTVGGVDLARVVEIVNGYTITFEDGQYAVTLLGANSNVGDVINVNQVSIRSANSAGLVTSKAIEYGEYNGRVTVKVGSQYKGTVYPVGTYRQPVNNITDAVALAKEIYGFPEIHVIGDLDLVDGDDVSNLLITGTSHVNTIITVADGTNCLKTGFSEVDLRGVLDGDSEISNCIVRDISYFNGHIHNSYLDGTLTLRGTKPANISNCSILDISNPPTIDCGGSGQNLIMPDWSGLLNIKNLTGNSKMGIGLNNGELYIEDTCTAGVIAVMGNGQVFDESGPACYVIDRVIDGSELSNIQVLVENLRPHHTGTGNVWYWDPVNGNDVFGGDHPKRACNSFQHIHDNLVIDNNHDIIIAISGNPNGKTITTENIVISKNYTFLRGPGRDFQINSIDDNLPSIDIEGNGVEVAGMIVTTELTNTISAIRSHGTFPLISNIFIENSVNGIQIHDGNNGIVSECTINHNTGYGIKIAAATDHTEIKYTQIGNCGNNGIIVDLAAGAHEVELNNCVIHANTGYGIDVINGDGVLIKDDNAIFNNSLGDYQGTVIDLRPDFNDITLVDNDLDRITDRVLSTDATPYYDHENTLGASIEHFKHIQYTIFIDPEGDPDGDGSQHKPFDNEADGIDYAEDHGLKDLVIYSDIELTHNLKNFVIRGVGTPKIDLNNQDLKNSEFSHCLLTGTYKKSITAQACKLEDTMLNGFFENCALSGALLIPDKATTFVTNTKPQVVGFVKPTFDIGGSNGTANLIIVSYEGGATILNCNKSTDDVKIVLHGGIIELDTSCTAGKVILFGEGTLINNSSLIIGTELINNLIDPATLNNTNATVHTIDGKVDIIDSNVDTINTTTQSIENKVDIIDANVDDIEAIVTSTESKVDIIDANVDTINATTQSTDGKVDIIDANVDTINTTTQATDGKVDTLITTTDSIENKVDIIDSNVDVIKAVTQSTESKVDIIDSNVDTLITTTDSINGKVDVIDANVDAIGITTTSTENKVDIIDVNVDTINTTTQSTDGKVDAIGITTDSIEDKVDIIDANVDDILANQGDLGTEIDTIPEKVWNVDKDTAFNSNSMGEWVSKKLLSIKVFLGLQ